MVALAVAWGQLQSDPAPASSGSVTTSSAKPPVPTLSSTPSLSPSPSASSPSPSPTSASPSASGSGSTSPSPSTSISAAPPVDRSVRVVVLNGTRRTGLGAKVARQLRALGWNVTSVANWRRTTIDETTVFVDGEDAAAETMLRDLPVGDTIEVPLSGMPGNRLVVVVGDDYPRG